MKKKDILELIKYHIDNNEKAFRDKAYEIARYFDKGGDAQLAEYIMALLSDLNVFMPQGNLDNYSYLRKTGGKTSSLCLPNAVSDDIKGAINAITRKIGVHKLLFEGAPGTGKTEAAYRIGALTHRDLYLVDSSQLIDSKLGQTAKNLTGMFDELNSLPRPDKVIILFDEIDSLALDRINSNDLREMGRVTSTLLRELDSLNESIVIIATTNLFSRLDKALIRRFDAVINFDKYSQEDLREVFMTLFEDYSKRIGLTSKDIKLLKKIISIGELPMPGDLHNIIKTSLAFNSGDNFGYLCSIYTKLYNREPNIDTLYREGFSIREIGVLLNKPKTNIARLLQERN